jgi:VWFA-related protein
VQDVLFPTRRVCRVLVTTLLLHTFCVGSSLFALEHRLACTVLVRNSEGQSLSDLNADDFRASAAEHIALPLRECRNLRPPADLQRQRPPEQYFISNRPLAAFAFPQPVTIVLLDTRNTDSEFQPWLEAQAVRLASLLRPGEDIAFWQLTQQGLKLLHQFSNAATQLADAIAPSSLTKVNGHWKIQAEKLTPLEPETAHQLTQESSRTELRAQRNESTQVALMQLGQYLGQFDGRKNLVWIAADFPSLTKQDGKSLRQSEVDADNPMLRALNEANIAVYPVEVRSAIAEEPFQPLPAGSLSHIPLAKRRALSSDFAKNMNVLAAFTGGKALANRSQLAEAMFDALEQTRFAYQLEFSVPDTIWDGKPHLLQIRTHPKDASVLAKHVFYAASPSPFTAAADSVFDAQQIGLSVHPEFSGSVMELQIYFAAQDLGWVSQGDHWQTTVDLEIREGASAQVVVQRASHDFQLSAAQHNNLALQTVMLHLTMNPSDVEKKLRITARSGHFSRIGSVTMPGFPAQ